MSSRSSHDHSSSKRPPSLFSFETSHSKTIMSIASTLDRFALPLEEIKSQSKQDLNGSNLRPRGQSQRGQEERHTFQQDEDAIELADKSIRSRSRNGDQPAEEMKREDSTTSVLPPPDSEEQPKEGGAEGWLMVFACSMSFFITLGLVYSFGVLQSELIARGVASASTLGWVSSTTVISLPVFAIPCNSFCIKFGNRIVSII